MFILYENNNKEKGRLFSVVEDVRDYLERSFYVDDDSFDNFLDDAYDSVEVLGSFYDMSYVLKSIDRVTYNYDKDMYTQELINDTISELERIGEATIGDYQIVEEEEDED